MEHRPSYLADLTEFLEDHRTHGTLTGKATEPAWNGYLLTVACSCGVTFERWITPWDAELDLLHHGDRLTKASIHRSWPRAH